MNAVEFYRQHVQRLTVRNGQAKGLCPFHDDHRPSLSINIDTGAWSCHAGCGDGNVAGFAHKLGVSAPDNDHLDRRRMVAAYDYRDEAGRVIFQQVRYEPKDFRARRPDGAGGWIYNLHGVPRVLYRLPELLKGHDPVLIVEGEKDVDRLRALGFTATTNSGGAGKWRDQYNETLRGRDVVIIPDNDDPGRAHAEAVARSLAGKAKRIALLTLPGLPPKGDVSDWLDQGHTAEELRALIPQAPEWRQAASASPQREGLALIPLRELLSEAEEQVRWVVSERLPSGGLSLLGARPKVGKSTTARCLALEVARGEPFLGWATARGPVFYLALEEKRAEVRAHFRAMGATKDDPIFVFIAPSPQDGLAQLRQAVERERPALIIVDPLLKLVRVKDANDYAQVAHALEPLLTLARETGAHVMGVHHLGKGERSGGDAILGSTAIFAAVDTALLLKRTDKYRTLYSIQRYGEDLEEIVLALDPVTRTLSAGPSRRVADETQEAEAILDYLRGKPESVEEAEIHEAVEGRKAVKVRALRTLVDQKKVTRSGEGRRGAPYLYSISSFLVPVYTGEPEYQRPKNSVSSDDQSLYSRSGENELFGESGESREPDSRTLEEADL